MSAPELPTGPVDVIVVGSGAAGSVIAARFAEAGRRVLILEAGPVRHQGQMISSTLHARRMKWSGPTVIEEGAHPVGHVFNAAYGTGGAALHHYAVWPRLHPEDFRMHGDFGRGRRPDPEGAAGDIQNERLDDDQDGHQQEHRQEQMPATDELGKSGAGPFAHGGTMGWR